MRAPSASAGTVSAARPASSSPSVPATPSSPSLPSAPSATSSPAASSRYRNNAARHLTGIARDLQFRLRHRLGSEHGFHDLRPSLGPFLSLVWTGGRPITALAEQLGITKQACSQLANLAERAGYLEREPDPEDRRSKLVRLSPRGLRLVERAVEIISETDADYAALVGPVAYGRFTAALASLYAGLHVPTHSDPALIATARQTVGTLPLIAEKVQQDLMHATAARGHAGLKMSHSQILPFLGPAGAKMNELARIQRVTRQTISATARDLESLGYVLGGPDPDDGRAVVLQLTERGTHLIRDSIEALGDLEASIREILGVRGLEQLQEVAQDLYTALGIEDDLFEGSAARRRDPSGIQTQPSRKRSSDIERLATELRGELGSRDARRLAALLDHRETRTTPIEPRAASNPRGSAI
jgi:DNA-binding MarR family transcriptional regulator